MKPRCCDTLETWFRVDGCLFCRRAQPEPSPPTGPAITREEPAGMICALLWHLVGDNSLDFVCDSISVLHHCYLLASDTCSILTSQSITL